MFIKAGTVLPLMQTKQGNETCLSLTDCYANQVTMQVYLDSKNEADGLWYVDDGISEQ